MSDTKLPDVCLYVCILWTYRGRARWGETLSGNVETIRSCCRVYNLLHTLLTSDGYTDIQVKRLAD